MTGTPGDLQPMPYGPLISNTIQLSPHYGALSAYFNRGILATQATAHVLSDGSPAQAMTTVNAHIDTPGDPLRMDLAGQMIGTGARRGHAPAPGPAGRVRRDHARRGPQRRDALTFLPMKISQRANPYLKTH
jgi:hypothetical protein